MSSETLLSCTVTGQGAGGDEVLSPKDVVTRRRVDISNVQKVLNAQGVRIE